MTIPYSSNQTLQAIAAVTPGSRYLNVHVLACQALAAGLVDLGILRGNPIELAADGVVALLFPHGVGHLLGLDVHDMEDLGDRAGYAPGRERAKAFGLRSLPAKPRPRTTSMPSTPKYSGETNW